MDGSVKTKIGALLKRNKGWAARFKKGGFKGVKKGSGPLEEKKLPRKGNKKGARKV